MMKLLDPSMDTLVANPLRRYVPSESSAVNLCLKQLPDVDLVFLMPILDKHRWSSDDNLEYCGVYVSPLIKELGINPAPESLATPSVVLHEVRKFLSWLIKGKPVVLEMLFHKGDELGHPVWQKIRDIRSQFVTLAAVKMLFSAAKGQLARLERWRVAQQEAVLLFYQIYRVCLQVESLLRTREMPVLEDTEIMLRIRTGEMPREEVLPLLRTMVTNVEQVLKENSLNLPEQCDVAFINAWLLELRRATLGQRPPPDFRYFENNTA